MKNLSVTTVRLLYCLVLISLFSYGFYYGGSFVDPEMIRDYVPTYFRDLPFFYKVFDVENNDYGVFRVRELSYFFNILDYQFMRFTVHHGANGFYSFLFFLMITLTVFTWSHLAIRKENRQYWFAGFLSSALVITSPCIFYGGFLYRSSKILAGACASSLLTLIFIKQKENQKKLGNGIFLLSVFSACVMVMSDEQGVFFALLGLLISFLQRKDPLWKTFGKVLTGALIFYGLYRLFLGPLLIQLVTGQDITRFPKQPETGLFDGIIPQWDKTLTGLKLGGKWLHFAIGNNPLSVVFFLGCLFAVIFRAGRTAKIASLLSFLILTWFLILMVHKHFGVALNGVDRRYYGVPYTLLLLPIMLIVFERVSLGVWWITGVLMLSLTGNFLNARFNFHKFSDNVFIGTVFPVGHPHRGLTYSSKDRLLECIRSEKAEFSNPTFSAIDYKFCNIMRKTNY